MRKLGLRDAALVFALVIVLLLMLLWFLGWPRVDNSIGEALPDKDRPALGTTRCRARPALRGNHVVVHDQR